MRRFPAFKHTRVQTAGDGRMYAIRDVWRGGADGGYQYTGNVNGRRPLARCEYATLRDGKLIWTPCLEGSLFTDLEAFP
jgi:hypothetical protein